jgi:hypothetical protein
MEMGAEVIPGSGDFVERVSTGLRSLLDEFSFELSGVSESAIDRSVSFANSETELSVFQEVGSTPCVIIGPIDSGQRFAMDFFLMAEGVERPRPFVADEAEGRAIHNVLEKYGIADALPGGIRVFRDQDFEAKLKGDARLLRAHCADILRGDFRLLPEVERLAGQEAREREEEHGL